MNSIFNELKDVCLKYELTSLQRLIASIENLIADKKIEIAIFGQFKAGKSSFINNIVGKSVLPTGVIPVTSIITSIQYGPNECTMIDLEDGHSKEIPLAEISDYVSESNNPNNVKHVEMARIELPDIKRLKGLSLLDTPGIGSINLNNTQTANDNVALTTIAIVCISAERPLAESDMELISNLIQNSYMVICLLTKVDLFTPEQLEEIMTFLKTSISNKIDQEIPIYKYSIKQDNNIYRNKIEEEVFLPYLKNFDEETENIVRHKILNLANSCLEYLELARNASMKTDEERDFLKSKIFDEKINISFIRHELSLIASDSKSRIRESVFNLFEPHIQDLISKLEQQYDKDFPSWQGNLYTVTRTYENWMKTVTGTELLKFIDENITDLQNILSNTNNKFKYYTKTFKERLEGKVFEILNLTISAQEWQPSFKPMKKPDISVYPGFDTPIDLLWFLFPMFIFRPVFRRYFRKQIKAEVIKNVHRTTSVVSEKIFSEIDFNQEKTLSYIVDELQTLEHALSASNSMTDEYTETYKSLNHNMSHDILFK